MARKPSEGAVKADANPREGGKGPGLALPQILAFRQPQSSVLVQSNVDSERTLSGTLLKLVAGTRQKSITGLGRDLIAYSA